MRTHDRAILCALSLGFLTVTLDASALPVALPAIRNSFDGSISGLQWVSNAYVLAFASFILSAGRFADRYGPRTMFAVGVAGIASSSALCAFAPTLWSLVTFRLLQGLAGAVLTTSSYAILAHTFEAGPMRLRAFTAMNFSGSFGLVSGPVISGLLVQWVGWRSIFLLNIAVGALLMLVLRFVSSRHSNASLKLDVFGQVLSVAMLCSLAYALIESRASGWLSTAGASALFSIAMLVAFVAAERRATHRMIPLDLFRIPEFSAGTAIIGLWRGALYGFMFFLALYFSVVKDFSSRRSGFAFLPMTIFMLVGNMSGPALTRRFGLWAVAILGLTVATVGAAILAVATPTYAVLAVAFALIGGGGGIGIPAASNVCLSNVPVSDAGIASGVFNSGGQTGMLIGIAVIGGFAHRLDEGSLHAAATGAAIALGLAALLSARHLKVKAP